MFTVSIEAKSFQELRQKCAEIIASEIKVEHKTPTNAEFQDTPAPIEDSQMDFDFDVKKKSTKKPKVKKEKVVEESKPEPVVLTNVSRQQVQEALQEVNVVKGILFARSLLQKYGAEKMSDLKPEDYFSFVGSCKEISKEITSE